MLKRIKTILVGAIVMIFAVPGMVLPASTADVCGRGYIAGFEGPDDRTSKFCTVVGDNIYCSDQEDLFLFIAIDNTGFPAPSFPPDHEHYILRAGYPWISILYDDKWRWQAIRSQLETALAANLAVVIRTHSGTCASEDRNFEVMLCSEREMCGYGQ